MLASTNWIHRQIYALLCIYMHARPPLRLQDRPGQKSYHQQGCVNHRLCILQWRIRELATCKITSANAQYLRSFQTRGVDKAHAISRENQCLTSPAAYISRSPDCIQPDHESPLPYPVVAGSIRCQCQHPVLNNKL